MCSPRGLVLSRRSSAIGAWRTGGSERRGEELRLDTENRAHVVFSGVFVAESATIAASVASYYYYLYLIFGEIYYQPRHPTSEWQATGRFLSVDYYLARKPKSFRVALPRRSDDEGPRLGQYCISEVLGTPSASNSENHTTRQRSCPSRWLRRMSS